MKNIQIISFFFNENVKRNLPFSPLKQSNFTLHMRFSTIHDERLSTRCVAGRKRLSRGKVGKRVNANVSLPARYTSSCYTINRFDVTLVPASNSRLPFDLFLFAVRAFRLHFLILTHLERTKYMRALVNHFERKRTKRGNAR